jgi:hypothetical protein
MTFRRDIALFDAGDEGWLDPCAPGFLMGTNKKEGGGSVSSNRHQMRASVIGVA